jgi:hypothetical protein
MEGVLVEIISQWGVLGLVLAGIVYLIWDGIKTKKQQRDRIEQHLGTAVGEIEKHVDDRIDIVNDRIDVVNDKVDLHYEILSKRIDASSDVVVDKLTQQKDQSNKNHIEAAFNQFEQAPKIHRILKLYRERIGCDHIFLAIFHNGSTSINGIPFCKFDIIAEKFKPGYNGDFREYTTLYKDTDIIIHDNLPVVASQEDYIYFKIQPDGSSELEDLDETLYRRCVKNGIKQIALNILRDANMVPIGFVGCTDYDYDVLNLHELNNCEKELEEIYITNHANKK